jgi:hypothetical protein
VRKIDVKTPLNFQAAAFCAAILIESRHMTRRKNVGASSVYCWGLFRLLYPIAECLLNIMMPERIRCDYGESFFSLLKVWSGLKVC